MRSHAPFQPIVTKFYMWGRIVDMITEKLAHFFKLTKGFWSYRTNWGIQGPPPPSY